MFLPFDKAGVYWLRPELYSLSKSFVLGVSTLKSIAESDMGLLDGLLGGIVGAEMVTVVNGLIEKHGGVQGLVSEFEQQGLGGMIQSWVGTGANQPISPEQIHQTIGIDTLKQFAEKLGISPEVLAGKLADVLPKTVDQLTPNGKIS